MEPTVLEIATPWAVWAAIGAGGIVGILALLRTGGGAFARLGEALRGALGSDDEGEGDFAPRDAFLVTASMSALPLVAGTATAIAMGGPGAIFWLVVAGVVVSGYRFLDAGLATRHGGADAGRDAKGAIGAVATSLRRWPSAGFVYAFLGLGAAGLAGAALAGKSVAEAARGAGWPGAYVALALGAAGVAIALLGPRRTAALARTVAPIALSAILIAGIAALVAHPDRIGRALGRILSQSFEGAAPSGGFIGAFVVEAIRGGLGLGIAPTAATFGAASTIHADTRHGDARRAALAAAVEPLVSIVLVALLVGVPILTSRAWNRPGPARYGLAESVALTATAASAAEALDTERRFNSVTRWRKGTTLDRIFFLGGRGMLEDVKMIDRGRAADVALFFHQGQVQRIQYPDYTGRGTNARLVDAPLTRVGGIVLAGNGLRRGPELVAAALADGLPSGLAAPLVALATILLALGALVGWTHFASRVSAALSEPGIARIMSVAVGAAAALGAVKRAPWLVPAAAVLVGLLALVHGAALLVGSGEGRDLTGQGGER